MRAPAFLVLGLSLLLPLRAQDPTVATFSIAARDPATGALGVAVQSRVAAVGAVVPFAEAGVGAIATQANANPQYGPDGLRLLRDGKSPKDAIEAMTTADAGRDSRQLGVVDAKGGVASFTGSRCNAWAGHHEGDGYCCQGNILKGEQVVAEMARAYEATAALPFAERLLAALDAGQAAGGDKRGMQSAAILIVRKNAGYGGFTDRMVDLRVDDHATPIQELRRVHAVFAGGMLRSSLGRLLETGRGAKDRAPFLADLHLWVRFVPELPRNLKEEEKAELVALLKQRRESASAAIQAELDKDLARLEPKAR